MDDNKKERNSHLHNNLQSVEMRLHKDKTTKDQDEYCL